MSTIKQPFPGVEERRRAVRRIVRQVRQETGCDLLHGEWCGAKWQEADKRFAALMDPYNHPTETVTQ